jgi:hypothetical protein
MSPNGPEGQWRVRVPAGEYGPLDLQTLEAWVRDRRVGPNDAVYSPLTGGWMPASSVPQLTYLFGSAPPVVLPSRYKGVKGWLLFFCIVVAILAPIGTLMSLPQTLRMGRELLGPNHPLTRHMLLWSLVSLPVVAFGMVAGIRLWKVKPGAVALAKIYLVLNLAMAVVGTLLGPDFRPLYEAMARRPGVGMDLRLFQWIGFAWGIVWFLIWFSYFSVSKRVKATYGR